ncbi:MAG TPA: beta-galactosidase GalB [Bryobacteraceae bacterium]|nr:beta-galactosidase GalB [Bryobacteraceae bacterium]
MKRRTFLTGLSAVAALRGAPETTAPSGPRRISFNDDWRFFKGEAEDAAQPDFDDGSWQQLRLPHDWAIFERFDRDLNPHTGALPAFGIAWYRKTFTLPASARGRYFTILFDGAMANSRVWCNGHDLGGRPYGYSSFFFDLTPHLRFGEPNVIAVRLAPEDHSSRWYPGAGIYRNVWLEETGPVHVPIWGTYVTTSNVSADFADVTVRTEVRNLSNEIAEVTIIPKILDEVPVVISDFVSNGIVIPPNGMQVDTKTLRLVKPKLWDIDNPFLYSISCEIRQKGRTVDRYVTPFGVRAIAFSNNRGFELNGRYLKLHGVCNHHDLGALGAAVNRRAIERQLQILKQAGVNAIRTSHNPPAPELLDLCDQMGFVVMDEAFDCWRVPKVPNGYQKYFDEWSERDVRDMVRRDRNHPSVIMWSIGNEIPEQGRPEGRDEARRLVRFFHEEDPTRPTTSAFNIPESAFKSGLADEVDLVGINYRPWMYEEFTKAHPKSILLGSETSSCVSSRGVYHLPLVKYQKDPSLEISSYDIIAASWAYMPDVEFTYQDRLPAILGEFVWTGFDYLGEPTPYFDYHPGADNSHDWPARSSYFGMVDLAGFPKDRYYLYQSVWTKDPMIHLLPHWNWEGREGQPIPVMCYSNCDEVELFHNGKSLGRKRRGADLVELPAGPNVSREEKFFTQYRHLWQVPFVPGSLEAVGYRGGKVAARTQTRTAGPAAKVKLTPDRNIIHADGDDLSFITVRIEDKDGTLCPKAANLVRFRLDGPGTIAGVDNGDPATIEPFHTDYRNAFNGLALLIVRSQPGRTGTVRITATAAGLAEASTEIVTRG